MQQPTQFSRAFKQLDIQLYTANSPQAKGRVERLFKTLQDRLVKEMRLQGICSIDQAKQFLEQYRLKHNQLHLRHCESSVEMTTHVGLHPDEYSMTFCRVPTNELSVPITLFRNQMVVQAIST